MYFEFVDIAEDEQFVIENIDSFDADYPYHFHPEYEIIFVKNTSGTRFISNTVSAFEGYDMAVIGANVPHKWKFEKTTGKQLGYVLKFRESLIKNCLIQGPWSRKLLDFFHQSMTGLFLENTVELGIYEQKLRNLSRKKGLKRITGVLELLDLISRFNGWVPLAGKCPVQTPGGNEMEILDHVFNHIFNNFRDDINLSTLAEKFHYSKSGFFQFFKRHTSYNFSDFLYRVRVQEGCKLLKDSCQNIESIAFECGFNNVSYFNRKFKQNMGCSPRDYRKRY
ncbi:MAG: AraC family transcriptional regulator [Bacteroidota bacterium]